MASGAVVVAALVAACASPVGQDGSPTGGAVVTAQAADARLHGTLVEPPLSRPDETLLDDRGRPFSLARRPADELTVLFFGYTHCPDVCPTTMADLARARGLVAEGQRSRVQVVFVSEDPDRDDPAALRLWLGRFDGTFVGLQGGNAVTERMLDELYSSRTRKVVKPEEPVTHPDTGHGHHRHGRYGIEHTGMVYAFGPGGSSVVYSGGVTPDEYAADFARLLGGDS